MCDTTAPVRSTRSRSSAVEVAGSHRTDTPKAPVRSTRCAPRAPRSLTLLASLAAFAPCGAPGCAPSSSERPLSVPPRTAPQPHPPQPTALLASLRCSSLARGRARRAASAARARGGCRSERVSVDSPQDARGGPLGPPCGEAWGHTGSRLSHASRHSEGRGRDRDRDRSGDRDRDRSGDRDRDRSGDRDRDRTRDGDRDTRRTRATRTPGARPARPSPRCRGDSPARGVASSPRRGPSRPTRRRRCLASRSGSRRR